MGDLDPTQATIFQPYMGLWKLESDGEPIVTQFSRLLPVRSLGAPAMLKIALFDEERQGAEVMDWWGGQGAVRVLAREGDGVLLERATGTRSLADMARHGSDDKATRILCEVAATLHTPRTTPPPSGLPDLERWFEPLAPIAAARGGILARTAEMAAELLSGPRDEVVLHGDLHHGNVLDAGDRGWLAIDPKGLIGERGFDFANIFRNPEHAFGADPDRLGWQATVVAESIGIDRSRILQWVMAFAGLSAAWILGETAPSDSDLAMAHTDLAIAESVARLLGN
jgi:streptomycin 6-kinase